MRTFVKLSGITDAAGVALVPDGGAVGFVVGVPTSPRNIAPEAIPPLIEALSKEAEAWGIVKDPTTALVHQLFDDVGVDRLQVYGTVPPDLEFLEIHHMVPSLAIGRPGSGEPDPTVPPAEDFARLHLDASGDPLPAGSPERPDWEVCRRLVDANPGRKLLLAGGITPENVAEALEAVHPWGIDVSAGIETSPGHIDPARVRALLEAIAAADAQPS
jgi:phosphoribosylanthranilate isomerase